MIRKLLLASAAMVLAGCAENKSNINVVSGASTQKVQTVARSEPVFFNGHRYQIDYSYNQSMRAFDVRIKGTSRTMKAADRKSAVEIATSAVRHFACPKGTTGALAGDPSFASGTWELQARCA